MRGYLLNYLTQANWLRGDKRRAEVLGCEATACKQAIDDRFGLTIALETLAWMAAELGQHNRAAHLLGIAERARQESSAALVDVYRMQHEQSMSAACQGLGKTAYEAAFQRGRAMTIDEGSPLPSKTTSRPRRHRQPSPARMPY